MTGCPSLGIKHTLQLYSLTSVSALTRSATLAWWLTIF